MSAGEGLRAYGKGETDELSLPESEPECPPTSPLFLYFVVFLSSKETIVGGRKGGWGYLYGEIVVTRVFVDHPTL